MTTKPPPSAPGDRSPPNRKPDGQARSGLPAGGLSFATLLDPDSASSQVLDDLRALQGAARQVIEDSLARPDLPRDRLERLRASVLRQQGQAQALRLRLKEARHDAAGREIAELCDYFAQVLEQMADRLRARN